MNVKPIKTRYNGYLFRSRAEARWAMVFDEMNIKYIYEPEGLELSDGTRYLPDFYLPEIKTYFEVKGIMTDKDMHKIEQLQADLNVNVSIGYADMTFQTSEDWGGVWEITDARNSELVECLCCGHRYFRGDCGGWMCPFCDVVGDTASGLAMGDMFYTCEAIEKAKAAKFEFTEEQG